MAAIIFANCGLGAGILTRRNAADGEHKISTSLRTSIEIFSNVILVKRL